MIKNWLRFIVVWAVCLVFYLAHRGWMSWMILLSASGLPLFSLVVSLPAMLLSRIIVSMPDAVELDSEQSMDIRLKCPLPPPMWRVRIDVRHVLTGQTWRLQPGYDYPTDHCGAMYCHFSRGRVYDYMGLFFLPRKAPADVRVKVRPRARKPRKIPDMEKNIITYWRPKAGGGFSENHELRLYRPGDNLRQIHWKLSGKTGKLIYRESMERVSNRLLLCLVHGGDPRQLDTKLGGLLWLGMYLHEQELAYDVQAETVEGPRLWHVNCQQDLIQVVDALLCTLPLKEDGLSEPVCGLGQFYIGGDSDEAQ